VALVLNSNAKSFSWERERNIGPLPKDLKMVRDPSTGLDAFKRSSLR
jgi:hypothetical protein